MRDVARVIHYLITIEVILILVRVVISWVPNLDPHHPAVRLLRALVDPVMRPFRAMVPSFSGIDVSPILAILVLQVADGAVASYADGGQLDWVATLFYLVERVLLAVVAIMAIIVFVRLVISFLKPDPWHPTVRLLRDMSRPLVDPFGRLLPRSRGVDTAAISALVCLVAAYVIIQAVLDRLVARV